MNLPLFRIVALSIALLGSAAPAFAASASASSSLGGVWRTAQGRGLVVFKSCGAAVCGYLVDTISSPMSYRTLLIAGLIPANQTWSEGRIIDPRSGRTYAGEVQALEGGRLKVTGCLVRPLCSSQVWSRVP